MTLPWVRIDTNLHAHDKILQLVNDNNNPRRWQAAFSYICSIGWSAASATDGHIPRYALTHIHGTTTTANLLVSHGLWEPTHDGWDIHNYAVRQELTAISQAKQRLRSEAAEKAACNRWHGPECWTPKGCGRTVNGY